jgi:hypothetical protein
MLGKKKQQLAYLKIEWAELEWEIAEAKVSNTDPEMRYLYVNDLQYKQCLIEEQMDKLEDELRTFPLKVMTVGFIIFVIGMFVYMTA